MKIVFLSLILFFNSCASDMSNFGKVNIYNSAINSQDKKFVFVVEDSFIKSHKSSKNDEENPLLSKAESDLLKKLLARQKLCLNENNYPSFQVVSKQEKIYDVTFANLIEENYNAKPAVPRTYYGRCKINQ